MAKTLIFNAGSGTSTALTNQDLINELKNFSSSMYGSMMNSLIGLDIQQFPNFNDKNYAVMLYHMARNTTQKSLLIDGFGENAYANGDPNNDSTTVPDYSYAHEHNYRNFSSNIQSVEHIGNLETSSTVLETGRTSNTFNQYFDFESPEYVSTDNGGFGTTSSQLHLTGTNIDNDSLLAKTKRLFNANKIKSIISQFYTGTDIKYAGQVGTAKYGESHGHNLLTKTAENGGIGEFYHGYENPYCRVWTHHYRYDQFKKTMRANNVDGNAANSINYWGDEFEWNPRDGEKHSNKVTHYGDGERYDYGWRTQHNQERRQANTVLDESTGLLTIAPKYRNGGSSNIHTKSCMFSIENLAWKDYDPYSFEQALSWEQRGPMGGRIMWFPPYNLKVSETNNAKWNSSDFIGRGESVYTYINSERTGTLSFTLLVDHPSSIDYASWHDDNGVHSTNDYLRYFAGCFGNGHNLGGENVDSGGYYDVINNPSGIISKNGGDNLLEVPPHFTDEYTKNLPIEDESTENEPPTTDTDETTPEDNPPIEDISVKFNVYFPNNYSGVYDSPTQYNKKYDSQIDAILYLLMGKGAQKSNDGIHDVALNSMNITNHGLGYEMTSTPLGKDDNNFIDGVYHKWYYRIDCYLENDTKYGRASDNHRNTIGQKILKTENRDSQSYNLNSSLENIEGGTQDDMYTLAEIASAIYKLNENTAVYDYLVNTIHVDKPRTDELSDLFSNPNYYLHSAICYGISSTAGYENNNDVLASERSKTVKHWLENSGIFGSINWEPMDNQPSNGGGIHEANTVESKQNRSACVELIFSSVKTKSINETEANTNSASISKGTEYVGATNFKYLYSKQIGNSRWDYYTENQGTTVFDEHNAPKYTYRTTDTTSDKNCDNLWVRIDGGPLIEACHAQKSDEYKYRGDRDRSKSLNKLRYDQEYHFYKQYFDDHPFVFKELTEKIKYFNPAFHSMTPEGFNARLTFLNQCTRQGATITRSDNLAGSTANNLAFGRPPFCILRIGDFYNQMIIIQSITYDFGVSGNLQWDLNPEGNGVQPMLCEVNISFTFIGGGDITGPVQRLQNAMSFNYYANTSFYDNRADRVEYQDTNWHTMGGNGNNEVDLNKSYSFTSKNSD